jgi:uncharacterized glyoxalase superfamily protein PhnB
LPKFNWGASVAIYVDDVDATFEKTLSAGAKVLDKVTDQFLGRPA